MKILVYGAGVVGSVYAARLAETGSDVTVLARGARAEELAEHGIVLERWDRGQRSEVQTALVSELDPDAPYDLVIVAVRRNQVASLLPQLAESRGTPTVLFLGNNAAGPVDLVAALGRPRVLMGFGAVAGVREGHVVRYLAPGPKDQGRTYAGELDGLTTARLRRIGAAFEAAGLPLVVERSIEGWLKTHAAVVVPLALAVYAAAGDNLRLGRTRDAALLAVRAISECLKGLRERGVPLVPGWIQAVDWVPEPALVALLRRVAGTERARIALVSHANAARDEMAHLLAELRGTMAGSTPTPALDELETFLDPDEPPLPDGSSEVPIRWRGVLASAGAVALAVLLLAGRHR